jgi:hypothetical protein
MAKDFDIYGQTEKEMKRETKIRKIKNPDQVKVSFYIDKDLDLRFDQLVLDMKRRGVTTSKSKLIREEIALILEKYKQIDRKTE